MPEQHAFCETIAAIVVHIRPLTDAGMKPSGGADTKALCGAHAQWDLRSDVTSATVERWVTRDQYPNICTACVEKWKAAT